MKKRFVSILLCASMVVMGIAGCGKATDKNGEEDGVVKLRMMGYNPESTRATYLKYLDEKLPNIEIEFEFVSNDNFMNVLNSQIQAGEGPDIIEAGAQTKLQAKSGALLDLSDQEFVSQYSETGLQAYTADGKVYATPLQSWFEGIYYNKKIFRENGIEVPKSWEEFIKVHKILSDKGIKPQTMGAQSFEPMAKQTMALANNMFYSKTESEGFDEAFDSGESKLEEAWLPAAEEWYKIIEEDCLTEDMLGLSYDQALDEFATEKAAMWQCGPWAVSTIMEKNSDIELGMFPIPGMDETEAGWLVGGPGSGLAINAKSKHIDEALQVLEVTATEEAQQALVKDNAGSSFVKGVDVDLGDVYADCEAAFREGHVLASFVSNWTNGQAIYEAYGKSLQEVLAGTKTVKEALADADSTNLVLINSME